jgi:hypothetical protein
MTYMQRMYILLLPVALAGISACSAAHKGASAAPPAAEPTGWSASALRTAEQLADTMRAAGVACDNYAPGDFAAFDEDYKRQLPLPAAFTSCATGEDDEINFQVFADAKQALAFVDAKQALLCAKAKKLKMVGFPGFVHIDGDNWVVEVNDKDTADTLAGILGGKAQQIPCAEE